MLKAKDKEARRGNLITFAIVLALTLVTMVLENVMSPGALQLIGGQQSGAAQCTGMGARTGDIVIGDICRSQSTHQIF